MMKFSAFILSYLAFSLNFHHYRATIIDKYCKNVELSDWMNSFSDNNLIDFNYDLIQKSRDDENLISDLAQNKNSFSKGDVLSYIESKWSIVTEAVLFVVFLGSLVFYIVICCCIKCNRCKIRQSSQILAKKSCFLWFCSFLMFFGLIGSVIMVILFNERYSIENNRVRCQLETIFDEFENGNGIFLGLDTISKNMDIVVNSFPNDLKLMNDQFNETSWILDGAALINGQILNLYTDHKYSTVRNCDPGNYSLVTPDYFMTLGPIDQQNSVTSKLAFNFQESLGSQADVFSKLKNNIQELNASFKVSFQLLQSAKKRIDSMKNNLISFQGKVSDFFDNQGSLISSGFYYGTIVLISHAAFSTFLGMFVILSTRCSKKPYHKWNYLTLCCFCISTVFIFLVIMVLIPLSIALMESCSVVKETFSDSASYNRYSQLFLPAEDIELYKVCLLKKGELASFLDLSDTFTNIGKISNSLNLVVSGNMDWITQIRNETNYINKVLSFEIDSIGVGKNNFENPSYALADLNSWSDYSINKSNQILHCTISQDKFVFDKSECSTYQTIFDANLPTNQYFSEKICIDLIDLGDDDNRINSRIGSYFDGCTPVNNNILGDSLAQIYTLEVKTLFGYKSGVVSTFGRILEDLENLKTRENEFHKNLTIFSAETLDSLRPQINPLINVVSDNKKGLIEGLNCSFLKSSAGNFIERSCKEFIPGVYQLSILIFLCGCFTFLNSMLFLKHLFILKSSSQNYKVDLNQKVNQNENQKETVNTYENLNANFRPSYRGESTENKAMENTTTILTTAVTSHCRVPDCTENHPRHQCVFCENQDSSHFAIDCPDTIELYHATLFENLLITDGIAEIGLTPRNNSNRFGLGIYFAQKEFAEELRLFLEETQKKQGVLLRCKVYLGKCKNFEDNTDFDGEWSQHFDSCTARHPPWLFSKSQQYFQEWCLKDQNKVRIYDVIINDKAHPMKDFKQILETKELLRQIMKDNSNIIQLLMTGG